MFCQTTIFNNPVKRVDGLATSHKSNIVVMKIEFIMQRKKNGTSTSHLLQER